MIHPVVFNPSSIAVIGGSADVAKPGGKVLENLLAGGYPHPLYAVNPKGCAVNGVIPVLHLNDLPPVDLVILAIPAEHCLAAVRHTLALGARGFIVFSAGFGEAGVEGKALEQEMADIIEMHKGTLLGPNGIGVIQKAYKGVFTTPVPEYDPRGCVLISSSGATAVFILEAAAQSGLRFSEVYSIGNAVHTGAEDILAHLDDANLPDQHPRIILLYLEDIRSPFRFAKHAASLVQKGFQIAAIKSGFSEAGGRAASSHTGAMATSDGLIRALFHKAGIVYCSGREELISVACVWQNKPLKGKNIAVITHAGGSAVMLTDVLSTHGMDVPPISDELGKELLAKLHLGSSVKNPIDFLATGTAKHLQIIIEFCQNLDFIDGLVVVFGSPGLFHVGDAYAVLHDKMLTTQKPIFPVLPSSVNAAQEIREFVARGHVHFSDEVVLGKALAHAYHRPQPSFGLEELPELDVSRIQSIISGAEEGYLSPESTRDVLKAAGIAVAEQHVCRKDDAFLDAVERVGFPMVMKVVGPVHKTDVGGVVLNVRSVDHARTEYRRLMALPEAEGVLFQEMVHGEELFCGAVRQGHYGHLVMLGLGGIFVEVLRDVAQGLAPLKKDEVEAMIQTLKAYPIIQGYRGREGVSEEDFVEAVTRIAALVYTAPEIAELDVNPFMANASRVVVVDARIRISR